MFGTTTGARHVGTLDQAAPFQPFQLTAPLGVPGIPFGHRIEDDQPWEFDPFLLKRSGRVKALVGMTLGEIGVGKTTLAKVMAARFAGFSAGRGRRFRISLDDTKGNDGVPEYQLLTEFLGEEEAELARYKINPLDQAMGMHRSEQLSMLREMCEHNNTSLSTIDVHILKTALFHMLDRSPEHASLELLQEVLLNETFDQISPAELQAFGGQQAQLRLRDAIMEVYLRIDNILNGELGDVFGGTHSIADILSRRIVALDYTGLEEDALALIQSLIWRWKTSALRRNDARFMVDMEIHDENYAMWSHLVYARSMYNHIKRIRQQGGFLLMNSHRLNDYYTVGDAGSKERGYATNMVKDVSIWFLGRQSEDSIPEIRDRLGISRALGQTLMTLREGQFCCIIGKEEPVLFRLNLTETERLICESDDANRTQLSDYNEGAI